MSGFNQGGGVGKMMAEWIIEGEPSVDMAFWDVARFGDWAGLNFTKERTKYFYEHRTDIVYPFQEFSAGRPIRTFPIHDRLADKGAVFGFNFGCEHALWFAREGAERIDRYGYGRGNWFGAVGEECRAVRDGVGLLDISTFAKYSIVGDKAAEWLDFVLANRIAPAIGKTILSPMLSRKGRLIGDFSVTRLAADRFFLLGSGPMQRIHMRWFDQYRPSDGSVRIENLSARFCGLHIAGPAARDLLGLLAETDVDAHAFAFLSGRELAVGPCPCAIAIRVSFTGELGYELYMPAEYQRSVYDVLLNHGRRFGLRHFGSRALLSMRIEKAFPSWGNELTADYGPFAPGLDRFIRLDKTDFVGKTATLRIGMLAERLASLIVDAGDIDCFGGEAIYRRGELAGYVTSGAFGHRTVQSLALGYVRTPHFENGSNFEVETVGGRRAARLSRRPCYDPDGIRMRS
jgi:dimethylglycine dehydrogenase